MTDWSRPALLKPSGRIKSDAIERLARHDYERDFWGERAPKWQTMSANEKRPWLIRAADTLTFLETEGESP